MAVVIRLRRMGSKKKPFYRIAVTDSRFKRDGRFIEDIGTYNPRGEEGQFSLKEERAFYWLKQGAKPSDTVNDIFRKHGILKQFQQLKNSTALKENKEN